MDVEGGYSAAESQHDDPIADFEHVGQIVADDNHPEPLGTQVLDQVKHLARLGHA